MSGAELEQQLRALVEETGAKVVFTDLPAGSCTMAARPPAARPRRHRGERGESADAARLRHASAAVARGSGDGGGRARRADAQGDARDRHVALELYRIDDRLIHGQVVVGWGQPLDSAFSCSSTTRSRAATGSRSCIAWACRRRWMCSSHRWPTRRRKLDEWNRDKRPGILLTGHRHDGAARRAAKKSIRAVNLGGIHHRAGRVRAAALSLSHAARKCTRCSTSSGAASRSRRRMSLHRARCRSTRCSKGKDEEGAA